MPAAPISQPAIAVGSGAPPVYSKMLELERMAVIVPFETVVVLLDEREGGVSVADVLSTSDVLPSSEVACEVDGSGTAEEDEGAVEDETEPAEESAALLEDGSTLDESGTELLDAALLDTGGWLEGGCEDSLGEDSGVALLGSGIALLLGVGVSLLDSKAELADEDGDGGEEGILLELCDDDGGTLEASLLELGSAVGVAEVDIGVT